MEQRTCEMDGCSLKHYGGGWCYLHHAEALRDGRYIPRQRPYAKGRKRLPPSECGIAGCTNPARYKNPEYLCTKHYQRLRKSGTVRLANFRANDLPNDVRFWSRVVQSGECWVWTGALSRCGYGSINPTTYGAGLAHRYAWITLRGDIPQGLVLDHLCHNRPCVNPWHLDPVTIEVNSARRKRG